MLAKKKRRERAQAAAIAAVTARGDGDQLKQIEELSKRLQKMEADYSKVQRECEILRSANAQVSGGGLATEGAALPIEHDLAWESTVTVAADADSDAVQAAALAEEKVVAFLDGRTPKKVIVVPGRLVNVVL